MSQQVCDRSRRDGDVTIRAEDPRERHGRGGQVIVGRAGEQGGGGGEIAAARCGSARQVRSRFFPPSCCTYILLKDMVLLFCLQVNAVIQANGGAEELLKVGTPRVMAIDE